MHILFIFILGERCVYTNKQLDAIFSDSVLATTYQYLRKSNANDDHVSFVYW